MRLLKIAAACTLFITCPVVFESCCLSDCCFESFDSSLYDIEDISVASTPHPAVAPYPSIGSTAVKLSTVAFNFIFEIAYVSMMSHSGFQAVACDPKPPTCNQSITSVEITSSGEIGGFAPGKSLNTLFESFIYPTQPGGPVDAVYGIAYLPFLSFRTGKEVTTPQSAVFTFKIILDDGRVFNLVSERIDLVP